MKSANFAVRGIDPAIHYSVLVLQLGVRNFGIERVTYGRYEPNVPAQSLVNLILYCMGGSEHHGS